MMRRALAAVVVSFSVTGLAFASQNAPAHARSIPFADVKMIVEVNSTDGDAGLQVFLDGEAWQSIEVRSPDGRTILDVSAKGKNLKDLGLTELFSESEEPSFDELPLERFLARFPAGEYRFVGRTVEGRRLTGKAVLSHDIPAGPMLLSPQPDTPVTGDSVVVEWRPAIQPQGIDIVSYQVSVEREDPLRVVAVDLPSTATSITVPAEFLEPGTEYKVEVLAIEASGNQTITERTFVTA
jgi:Fibronectin type III domain